MANLNKFTSNHEVTKMCNHFFFKHKVVWIQTNYFLQMIKSSNIILNLNKIYILNRSFSCHINKLFRNAYHVKHNKQ